MMKFYHGRRPGMLKSFPIQLFLLACMLVLNIPLSLNAQIQQQRVYANDHREGTTPICLLCGVTSAASATDAGTNAPYTASTLNITAGVGGTVYQELLFPSATLPASSTPAIVKIGSGSVLTLNVLGGIYIQAYNGSTPVGNRVTAASASLSLLAAGNQAELFLPAPNAAYDRIRVTLDGSLLGVAANVNVYDGYYLAPAAGTVACNLPVEELHGVSGNVAAVGAVTNPLDAIDGNTATFAVLTATAGLAGFAQETAVFPGPSFIGDSARVIVSTSGSLVAAQLLNSIQVETFNGNQSNGVVNGSSGLLSLSLLSGTSNTAAITFVPTGIFDRVQIRLGGTLSVLSSLNVHEIQRAIPAPVLSAANQNATICTGGTVALAASVPAGESITWYNPQRVAVATSNTYTTPALNNSVTYAATASRTGCTNASDTLFVPITVKTIPAVPTISSNVTVCTGQPATLMVSNPDANVTYSWYANASGGTALATGMSFVTPALTADTIFYVEASNGTCSSSSRAAVAVVVSPLPQNAVASPANAAICAGNTASLSISNTQTGVTYNWYDAAIGGNLLFTGANFTTPQLSASTTYFIEGVNGTGCTSTSRTAVTVTVNPVPGLPVLADAMVSINPGNTATFSVVNPSDSLTYNWYSTPTGGTALATGPVFTSPALTATTNYYVEAVTNTHSCPSNGRTIATASVVTSVACGYAVTQQTVSQSICVLCNVAQPDNAVGSNETDFSTISTTVGVGGFGQLLDFGNTYYPGDSISLLLEIPGQLVSANLLGDIGVQTYSGNNPNGDLVLLNNQAATIQLLGGGGNLFRVTLPATRSFDGVAVTLQGVGLLSQLRIYAAQAYTAAPILSPQSVLVHAGDEQSPVFSGVLCTLCGVNNPDAAVDGDSTTYSTINASIGAVNGVGQLLKFPASFNAGDSIQLDLEIPGQLVGAQLLQGIQLETYTGNTANGDPVALDNTSLVSLQLIGGSNKFRVTVAANHPFNGVLVSINGTVAVLSSLRIYDAAVTYSSQNIVNVCGNASATLSVVVPQNATINWYTTAAGGTPIFTGSTFTTPPVTSNTTYYIESSRYGCVNPNRSVVNIVPNAIPNAPTSNAPDAAICQGDSVKLYATAPADVVFKWYTAASGGTAVYTGDTLVAKPATSITYYIESVNNTCTSQSRTPVAVTVNAPAANVAVNPSAATIGSGQTAAFTATSSSADATFNWYTQATGGNAVFTGANFTTPALTASTTYYLEAVTGSNCTLDTRIVVPVTVVGDGSSNPVPCDAADAVVNESNNVSGLCIACSVQNPSLSVDKDATTAATLRITAGLTGGYVQQTLKFPFTGDAGDTVAVLVNVQGGVTDVNLLGSVQMASYNGATYNNDRASVNNGSLVSVSLLPDTTQALLKFVPAQTFDRVEVRLNAGVATLITSLDILYAQRIKPSPVPLAASVQSCPGQSAALSITGPPNTTFKWYTVDSGGSPVFVGTAYQTPALTDTTVYYVESVSSTGCAASQRTPVTVNVPEAPAAPLVTNPAASICTGSSAVFEISNPVNGVTYNWYTTAAGGVPVYTGTTFTTPALTSDSTFYVEAVGEGGCSSRRTPLTVTVNTQLPAPAVSSNGVSACTGSSTVLSVQNPQSGITYNWYDAATGGNLLYSGASFTTPVNNADTTYYVEAQNGTNCTSARTPVNVTVSPLPAAPVVTVTPASGNVNSGESAVLDASSATSDVTFQWYLTATGGTPVFTGASYTTPGASMNTTYYVEAVSNTTGCASARTPVTITVNTGVNLSCDAANSEESGPVSICALCSISNGPNAVDADSTTFSSISIPLGVTGGYQQTLIFPSLSETGDSLSILLEVPSALLTAGVLSNIQLITLNGAVSNNDAQTVDGNPLVRVSILSSGKILVKYAPAAQFDRVQVQLTGVVGAAASLNIYYASRQVAAPQLTVANPVTICNGGTAVLTVTAATGSTIEWFSAATGGSALANADASGRSFTTPALTATTTYYAQAKRTSANCANPNRAVVTVVVDPAPATPAVTSNNVTVCAGQTATLQVANPQQGITYNWYDAAGSQVGTGIAFVTPVITTNAAFYVEAFNTTGCGSANNGGNAARTRVDVTATPIPAAPGVDNNNASVCAGNATLNITNPDAVLIYNWYNVAVGGSIVYSGASFVTPVLTDTTTYYVEAVNTSGCSSSARTQVTVNVSIAPAPPAVTSTAVTACSGNTATLSIQNAQPGVSYNWYDAATGGNLVGNGSSFVTPVITSDAVYYAAAVSSSNCSGSSRTAVTVTVQALPDAPVPDNVNPVICAGSNAVVNIQNIQSGVSYKWYDVATGGSLLYTGSDFTTPVLNASASYYFEAVSGAGCTSASRTTVMVTVNGRPGAPVIALSSTTVVCTGQPAALNINNPQSGIAYNWYDATAGGNLLFTGSSFVTPPLSANTTYFAEAAGNAGCASSGRTGVTVTVSNTAPAPVVTGASGTVCAGQSVSLLVQNVSGGIIYNWYDAATGGNLLFSGTSISTPPLVASVNYYVEAVSNNCGNSARTQVSILVNTLPVQPVVDSIARACAGNVVSLTVNNVQPGTAYNWYDAASGGNLLFTGSTYTTSTLSSSVTYYVESSSGSCSSTSRTQVDVAIIPQPGVPALVSGNNSSVCANSNTTLLVANPSADLTYNWYDAANGGARVSTGASFTTPVLTANAVYAVEAINASGCTSSARNVVNITVTGKPAAPVIASGNTQAVCTGSQATLSISNPVSGVTYNWYDAATGGTVVFSGASFVTPVLNAPTSYYVEGVNGNCTTDVRTQITVTVTNRPGAPVVNTTAATICGGQSARLSIDSVTAGASYHWYDAASGGNLLFTGSTFTTPVLNTSTSYYAEVSLGSCANTVRTRTEVTVVPVPAAPAVAAAGTNACIGKVTILSISNPQAILTYRWYDAASGGNLLANGTSFTTPVLNTNTTYYVEASVNAGCSSSARTAVQVALSTVPDAPAVDSGSISVCSGSNAVLRIRNAQPGYTYNWYTTATGGTAVFSGTSFTATGVTASVVYFAEAVNMGGCSSTARTPVSVNLLPSTAAPMVANSTPLVCPGSAVTLVASSPDAIAFRWYLASNGTNVVASGSTFTTGFITSDTSFYVESVNASGCTSSRAVVSIAVLRPLSAPVVRVVAATPTSVTFGWSAVTGASAYEITTDGGTSFVSPSSGAAGLTHTITGLKPNQSVAIQIHALSNNSCQNSGLSARVTGTATNPIGNDIYVPNVFTPNGDGKNDYFRPYGNMIATAELMIFAQWGEMLFRTTDGMRGWDGTAGGKQQAVGVYIYIINITLQDGKTLIKKGSVNLIR